MGHRTRLSASSFSTFRRRRGSSLDDTTVAQVEPGHGGGFDDAADDGVGGHAVGDTFVAQDDPVSQDLRRDGGEVLTQDIAAASDERERASRADEMDRRARAAAVVDCALELRYARCLQVARCGHQRRRVGDDRRIDVDLPHLALQLDELFGCENLTDLNRLADHPLHDSHLFVRRGISDDYLEHEPIDLRFRKRICAVGLDRVLRREDEKGLVDVEGFLADRDLLFLHHLEKSGLHLGRRAVHLVSEKEVAEDGPELGREIGFARVEHASPDEVGRNEVWGELDSTELATDGIRKRTDGRGLGETRYALDEDVTTREQCYKNALEQAILAHDDLANLEQELLDLLRYARGIDLFGRPRICDESLF